PVWQLANAIPLRFRCLSEPREGGVDAYLYEHDMKMDHLVDAHDELGHDPLRYDDGRFHVYGQETEIPPIRFFLQV
ncbi:hypothetical protein PENTCL1PPCAC_21122, partial [Pristionchus entomophagus]